MRKTLISVCEISWKEVRFYILKQYHFVRCMNFPNWVSDKYKIIEVNIFCIRFHLTQFDRKNYFYSALGTPSQDVGVDVLFKDVGKEKVKLSWILLETVQYSAD